MGVAVNVFCLEDAGQGVGAADCVGVEVDGMVFPEGAGVATASAMLSKHCLCGM